MNKLALSLTVLTLSACYGRIEDSASPSEPTHVREPDARQPPRFDTARLWIDDHVDLDKVTISKGCNLWLPGAGVQCLLVPKDEADIRVMADNGACVRNDDGKYTLARAFGGGDIVVYVQCMPRDKGIIRPDALVAVLGHEVGHQLGIWRHVAIGCDGTEPVHPSGVHVCGAALMNWLVGPPKLMALDLLAYDMREVDKSVIKGTVSTTRQALTTSGDEICALTQ